jgi:hypothetical protein
MFFEKYFERWKLLLAFLTGVCFVVYFILFRPLSQNVNGMEKQLITEKEKIILNSRYGFNASEISKTYFQARDENSQLEESLKTIRNYFRFSPLTVASNVNEEFKYLEFDSERRRLIAQVEVMSEQSGVIVDADLSNALPNFSRDGSDPRLLWVHLELFRFILETVVSIRDVEVIRVQTPEVKAFKQDRQVTSQVRWYELPARIELTGSGDRLMQFLKCIPLAEEDLWKAYGVRVPDKPALSIESAIITRETKDPDRAFLDISISGFVQMTNRLTEVPAP